VAGRRSCSACRPTTRTGTADVAGIHGVVRAGTALAAVTVLVACGAPSRSPAEVIATVPYDLSAPAASEQPSTAPSPTSGPRVYLLRGEVVAPATAPPTGPDPRSTAADALERLVAGPTDQDRAAGLSTALSRDARLSLVDLTAGRATVDVRSGEGPVGAGKLALAVAQVVLTLTSVTGIDEVVLSSDGQPISAPLPDGALTDRPLTARDYRSVARSG